MTLNLLRQSTLKPAISEWGYFNVPSSYNYAPLGPLGPLGCKVIIHKKNGTHHYWDFRMKDGWNVVVYL